MNGIWRAAILFIAEGAYVGRSPVAPGTVGTLVGVLLYFGIRNAGSYLYISFIILLCLVGTWAAGKAEIILGTKDSPSIVIDEIVGYLISMMVLPSTWGFVAAGFFLFRLFDIIKPWPLQGLQRIHGGVGVMLDDIGAGVYTNVILHIAEFIFSR